MSCSPPPPPANSSTRLSVKGFLDIKIPARKRKSISLFRVQVWKRRCWVVIRGDRSPAEATPSRSDVPGGNMGAGVGGITTHHRSSSVSSVPESRVGNGASGGGGGAVSLSVEVYTRHEGSNQPTEGTILHVDLVHKIRRAKSKSHPYAFEVCGRRGEALLYLSGNSEAESQRWMAAIRDMLWPPLYLEEITRTHPHNWPVSAISVGSCEEDWAGLGGLYGRLAVARASIVIKDVYSGMTRAEWPLTSVQRVYVSAGGELEDEGKIFIVQTRPAHPCGETYLYFYSTELSSLLEGLHEAVSGLLALGNSTGDDTSVLSDLSELSGALGSVVVLPQRLPELGGAVPRVRKATSVLDLSQVSATKSNSDLLMVPTSKSLGTSPQHKMLSHCRRKSMSETNLARICLDETDEELDTRDDDFDDIRPADQPKDRTSSSGSYNSYRSTDSGVRLSASPSNYDQATMRRLMTKSDSVDSGVRACVKEDLTRESLSSTGLLIESEDMRRNEAPSVDQNRSSDQNRRNVTSVEDVPDVNARVGAWCLQSAKARKSFFLKNLNAATIPSNRDKMLAKGLSRTLSESNKEITGVKEEYKKAMENPILTSKHTTVYEEIKDVLKPLTDKKQEKEHDYEDLEKIRKDIKRSYSFQEKTPPPPPLPPRRPKSFSPDPWADSTLSKTGTLRKIFGLSFYNKSHSQDSMLEMESSHLGEERLNGSTMASADVATVQALGTLPRPRRKTAMDIYERHQSFSSSPRMSPKQKIRNPFGISPSRSPRIPRPKNLFIFKSSNNEESSSSPCALAALRYQRQMMMQTQKTPSTDSSLADITTPDTPKPGSYYRPGYRPGSDHLETPDTGDETSGKDIISSHTLKSPKIMSKTFSFLRKFPKEKHESLERKRKSVIAMVPTIDPSDSSSKVPSSFSMDSFAVEAAIGRRAPEEPVSHVGGPPVTGRGVGGDCGRKTSESKLAGLPHPSSSSIMIPRSLAQERVCSVSPATTPSSLNATSSLGRPGTPPATDLPLRNANKQPPASNVWNIPGLTPTSSSTVRNRKPEHCEPQYANLGPDPDYMTVEEIKSAFRKSTANAIQSTNAHLQVSASPAIVDPGGYLSMGDIRQLKSMPESQIHQHHQQQQHHQLHSRPSEHEYMSMDDIQTSTSAYTSDYPNVCGSATSSMDRRQTHHHHPHHHPYLTQLRQLHQLMDTSSPTYATAEGSPLSTSACAGPGPISRLKEPPSLLQKSAPSSRKTSCCEGVIVPDDYLSPQEVGRLLRRELLHTATSRSRHQPSHQQQQHIHKP